MQVMCISRTGVSSESRDARLPLSRTLTSPSPYPYLQKQPRSYLHPDTPVASTALGPLHTTTTTTTTTTPDVQTQSATRQSRARDHGEFKSPLGAREDHQSRLENGRPLSRPRPTPYRRASSRPYCHGISTFETLDWYWRSVFVSMLGGGAAAARLGALASHTLCIENLTADRTTQKMLVSVLILPASFPASYYGAERFKYPRLQRTIGGVPPIHLRRRGKLYSHNPALHQRSIDHKK